MTDAELIAGCIDNDRRCQNALYKKYFPLMSNIALRYSANQDEAIHRLNSGYLKVLQNIHKYDSNFAFATFIRTILINHMIDEHRKDKKSRVNEEWSEQHETINGYAHNQGEARLEEQDLLDMLNILPEMSKKVFNLFVIDGYTHQQIGELLEMSEGTSKWHVSDARKRLKEQLFKKHAAENNKSQKV